VSAKTEWCVAIYRRASSCEISVGVPGNGKLNPAAEAAIREQNEKEERIKEERAEKERKAARKAEKKKAQGGNWFDEGSAPKPAGKKNW